MILVDYVDRHRVVLNGVCFVLSMIFEDKTPIDTIMAILILPKCSHKVDL